MSFPTDDPAKYAAELRAVESPAQREAARALISEYLHWVAEVAQKNYGLSFDVDAMVHSDIEDLSKFYPPTGRFYLVQHAGEYIGVGCLKRLADGLGEIQRMYMSASARSIHTPRIV